MHVSGKRAAISGTARATLGHLDVDQRDVRTVALGQLGQHLSRGSASPILAVGPHRRRPISTALHAGTRGARDAAEAVRRNRFQVNRRWWTLTAGAFDGQRAGAIANSSASTASKPSKMRSATSIVALWPVQ